MNEISLEQLSACSFTKLLRAKFQVEVQSGVKVGLELVAVTTPSSSGQQSVPFGNQKFEGFSLLFDGPADQPLGQRTYRFIHERLGSFDLFIVPVSVAGGSRQYEAVFNRRLVPPGESGKSG